MTTDRRDNSRQIRARRGSEIKAKHWTTEAAARALGLAHEIGTIEAGKAADLAVWRIADIAELGYWIGMPGPERRIFGGADA